MEFLLPHVVGGGPLRGSLELEAIAVRNLKRVGECNLSTVFLISMIQSNDIIVPNSPGCAYFLTDGTYLK